MATRSKGAIYEISQRPVAFGVIFLLCFALTVGFLSLVGDTPDPFTPAPTQPQTTNTPAPAATPELPTRVVAKDIGLDVAVVNPTSTNTDDLDNALEEGAVRYPTSALLGAQGTVYLFGHSSYLPVVIHQYYKTFDGIQNLKAGDVVSVYSGTTEYRYSVASVTMVDSTSDSSNIIQQGSGKFLVLTTCDSFGTTADRFVVVADFVGAYSLASSAAQ